MLSAAIDRYIYVTIHRRFEPTIRVSYSRTEVVNSLDEVQHELVREAMRLVEIGELKGDSHQIWRIEGGHCIARKRSPRVHHHPLLQPARVHPALPAGAVPAHPAAVGADRRR